ncbi:hypothetical protein SAMN02949497_1264 [Methylomagnum ishizawai]|uniref:Uncharacterized protein n=1 Tax=Methylomagnum ishizawai TaxID=1760988 RepID=A0A1Y6CTM1_9GAMM|nr:hypothetical protein [Methylomagnum ishizawai]SMF93968.1 hypothetical protein SAMN02949497_1264 [Methylomagnum ishizawai]
MSENANEIAETTSAEAAEVATERLDEATEADDETASESDGPSAAFVEGQQAALSGLTDADNPHPIGSGEAVDWNDGWVSIDVGINQSADPNAADYE